MWLQNDDEAYNLKGVGGIAALFSSYNKTLVNMLIKSISIFRRRERKYTRFQNNIKSVYFG
jgi:hypothetical protein